MKTKSRSMFSREELLHSKEYWMVKLQNELFVQLDEYMRVHNLNRSQLAEHLGVTKGYVSQVLNGNYDHRVSKLVELSLAIGKAPKLSFLDINEFVEKETESLIG